MKVPFILEDIQSITSDAFAKEVLDKITRYRLGIKLWHSELRDETSLESRERFTVDNPATVWHKDGIPSYIIAIKVIEGPGTIYENQGTVTILKPMQTLVIGAMGYELSNNHGFNASKHRHPGPESPRKILRAEFIPVDNSHKYYKLQEDLNHPDYCGQFF